MELTYKQLKNRDVINVVDGKCLGRITNVKFRFPQGVISGIYVPGRKVFGFRLFDRSELFIEDGKIVKIGGDVILVNLKCGETCAPSAPEGNRPPRPNKPRPPHCPPNGLADCNDLINSSYDAYDE